jgi:hypothetical protein
LPDGNGLRLLANFGTTVALPSPVRSTIVRFFNEVLLGVALTVPIAMTPLSLRAQDRSYHDKGHNDEHQWNAHEDKAYRIWAKENHRKYVSFAKLKEDDQQSYWAWRHDHSDALLKIEIK